MDDRIERVMVGWDRIDEHRTGSPGDAQTARWLSSEIESLGADPEIEEFAFNRLIPRDPCLEFGTQRIAGLPCFDAPGTPPEGIEGRLVPLGGNGEIGLLPFEPIGPAAGRLLDARRTTSHSGIDCGLRRELRCPGAGGDQRRCVWNALRPARAAGSDGTSRAAHRGRGIRRTGQADNRAAARADVSQQCRDHDPRPRARACTGRDHDPA